MCQPFWIKQKKSWRLELEERSNCNLSLMRFPPPTCNLPNCSLKRAVACNISMQAFVTLSVVVVGAGHTVFLFCKQWPTLTSAKISYLCAGGPQNRDVDVPWDSHWIRNVTPFHCTVLRIPTGYGATCLQRKGTQTNFPFWKVTPPTQKDFEFFLFVLCPEMFSHWNTQLVFVCVSGAFLRDHPESTGVRGECGLGPRPRPQHL